MNQNEQTPQAENKKLVVKVTEPSWFEKVFNPSVLMERARPIINQCLWSLGTMLLSQVIFKGKGGTPSNNTYQTYNGGYQQTPYRAYSQNTNQNQQTTKSGPDTWRDISFGTQAEAMEMLSILQDMITRYNRVRVADIYDHIVDENGSMIYKPKAQDNAWGWTNLSSATVEIRNADGRWVLNLPKPIALS